MKIQLNLPASERFRAWIEGLAPATQRRWLENYYDDLVRKGYYLRPEKIANAEGAPAGDPPAKRPRLSLPGAASPQVVDESSLRELTRLAADLLTALTKVARWLLDGGDRALAARLFGDFAPLEHVADWRRLQKLCIARADFFVDEQQRPRVLELNSTIPALPGYSDMLIDSWVRACARARGLDERADELVANTVSPTRDLYDSLLAHYRAAVPAGAPARPALLIVARRDDPEATELLHYEHYFRRRGHRAAHVSVDELTLDADGRMHARGETWDLLYRHIFARRVSAEEPLGRLLVDPGPNVVQNPVSSPLEVKGMLALLSQATAPFAEGDHARAWGLSSSERTSVATILPWTRLLTRGASTLADGTRVDNLAAWAEQNRHALVLKRSWDYGGRGVLVGPDTDNWSERVADAAQGQGAWIVQERVTATRARHLVCRHDADGRLEFGWHELIVDLGVFLNAGVPFRPLSASSRVSASSVVNIAGGGGLAPVVPLDVFEVLFAPVPTR